VLVIDGRSDLIFPLETLQRPMSRLPAAPQKDKRLFLLDGGRGDIRANSQKPIKETLAWFDRYLGPVKLWDNETEQVWNHYSPLIAMHSMAILRGTALLSARL
jgi:hypothetical protein